MKLNIKEIIEALINLFMESEGVCLLYKRNNKFIDTDDIMTLLY